MKFRRGVAAAASSAQDDGRLPLPEIGRFAVLGVLGSGSEGVVLLVHDRADASPEPLGLKVTRRLGRDPDAIERLRVEAKILAWLCHHNIVQVHRLLEKDGVPMVVMEYVEGASAMELLTHQRDGLPTAVAVEIALRAAVALEAAYEAPGPDGRPMRIVHRDIKPANLLVSVDGQVKVVDFGIATSAFDTHVGEEGDVMGTPGYVAPERRNGGADTPAVDAYALGASLYDMLTGRVLVQSVAESDHDASVQRALEHLPPAGKRSPEATAVADLVTAMCRYHPDQRLTSGDLVERLQRVRAMVGPPDMRAYARAHVLSIRRARSDVHPRSHPLWPHLAFLEQGGDVRDLALETPWPTRELALREVRAPEGVDELLARLEPAARWSFWSASRDTTRIVEALRGLRGTRDPRAVARAFDLTRHPHPAVSEAAWEVLAAAC